MNGGILYIEHCTEAMKYYIQVQMKCILNQCKEIQIWIKHKYKWIIFEIQFEIQYGSGISPAWIPLTTSEYIIFYKHLIVMTCYWISCDHLLSGKKIILI